MEDWIRLFNAEKREDLDMIRTKNAGIMEAIGKAEDILLILSAKGEITEDLRENLRQRILKETDTEILNDWVRAAATAKDAEEFQEKVRCCKFT